MCGKTHGVSGTKLAYDPNDPMSLIEALLNDPNRKRLWEDRPGEYVDPSGRGNNDPNSGNQPEDPNPPVALRDPRPPLNQPNDPGGPGTRNPPQLDPPSGGARLPPSDTYTGGTLVANNPPRDSYTGGTNVSGLTSTEPVRDTYTGGTLVSGLTSTETPRDPVTRGTDLLPVGSMMNRNQTIAYLEGRRPELGAALRPSFA